MAQAGGNINFKENISLYKAGEAICRAGENRGEMYIILKGKASVTSDGDSKPGQAPTVLDVGGVFGEMSLFLSKPVTASLKALSDVVLLTVSRGNIYDFFLKEPGIAFTFIKTLCTKLDEAANGPSSNAKKVASSFGIQLFPDGHGTYEFEESEFNPELVFEKSYECPVCGNAFKSAAVKTSKVTTIKTDIDLRTHYEGIEPLHYDIITCPNCLYSALQENFDSASYLNKKSITNAVTVFKPELRFDAGLERTADSVFTQYFLAILCANICYPKPQLIIARLYLKLSRLYSDVGDEEMSAFASKKSYDFYLDGYQNTDIPPKQHQQLLYMLGFLSMQAGDMIEARKFFFTARSAKDGSKLISSYADDRIQEIRASMSVDKT